MTEKPTTPDSLLERIAAAPVCPTVLPKPIEVLRPYAEALAAESFPALEILGRPMDAALDVFQQICQSKHRKLIAWGIGTVLSESDAARAAELRPDFLVSP